METRKQPVETNGSYSSREMPNANMRRYDSCVSRLESIILMPVVHRQQCGTFEVGFRDLFSYQQLHYWMFKYRLRFKVCVTRVERNCLQNKSIFAINKRGVFRWFKTHVRKTCFSRVTSNLPNVVLIQ